MGFWLFLFLEYFVSLIFCKLHLNSPLEPHRLNGISMELYRRLYTTVEIKQCFEQLWLFVIIPLECVSNKHDVFSRSLTGRFFFLTPWFAIIKRVEVPGVELILQFGYIWCLLLSDASPIDPRKEGMSLDLIDSVDAQPFLLIINKSSMCWWTFTWWGRRLPDLNWPPLV